MHGGDFLHPSIVLQALALHYDVAHVSMLGALQRIITDDAAARLSVTAWRLMSMFFEHPRHLSRLPQGLGRLVVADILVTIVASAPTYSGETTEIGC